MNHKYIQDQDIISKYILNRLDDMETDRFEEHLLYCEQCRKELEDTEKITGIIKSVSPSEIEGTGCKATSRKRITFRQFNNNFYKAAAAILILAGAGFVIYTGYFRKSKQLTYISKEVIVRDDSIKVDEDSDSITTTKIKIKGSTKSEPDKTKEYLAENYTPSPLFENQVNNPIRSGNIEVSAPINTTSLSIAEKIVFNWKTDIKEPLTLLIYTNKETVVFSKPVSSPYTLEIKLEYGLYYWQLETRDEAVYVGRFTVKK